MVLNEYVFQNNICFYSNCDNLSTAHFVPLCQLRIPLLINVSCREHECRLMCVTYTEILNLQF